MGSREHARPAHPAPVQGARARCRVESEWRRERDSATDGESRRRRNVVKNCLGLIKKNLRYTSTCPAHNVTDFSPACERFKSPHKPRSADATCTHTPCPVACLCPARWLQRARVEPLSVRIRRPPPAPSRAPASARAASHHALCLCTAPVYARRRCRRCSGARASTGFPARWGGAWT